MSPLPVKVRAVASVRPLAPLPLPVRVRLPL